MSIEEIKINNNLSLFDRVSFSFRDLLTNYKRFTIFFIPILLVVFFLVLRLTLLKGNAQQEVIAVKTSYYKWDKADSPDLAQLQEIKSFLKKRPELSPLYEGSIVQKLMANTQVSQSKPYMENILKRIGKYSTFYNKFSDISVLAAEKNYEKALRKSMSLKEEMISDKTFWERQKDHQYGSMLFAFNLLRIAMLNLALQDKDNELLSWKEFKKYAKWDQSGNEELTLDLDSKEFDKLLGHFTDQKVSLKDYIKHRESKLMHQAR